MKIRIFVSILSAMMILSAAEAQYKINKTRYDYRDYQWEPGDPYNPALCGAINLLVPGTGQMVAGESGRGAGFMVGYIGTAVIYFVGNYQAMTALDHEANGGPAYSDEGLGLMVVGMVGMLTVGIISIVDGVRVAKVNNLALRDKYNLGYGIRFEPYVAPLNPGTSNSAIQGGLTMQIRF